MNKFLITRVINIFFLFSAFQGRPNPMHHFLISLNHFLIGFGSSEGGPHYKINYSRNNERLDRLYLRIIYSVYVRLFLDGGKNCH